VTGPDRKAGQRPLIALAIALPLLAAGPAMSQDYIDVEAERERSAQPGVDRTPERPVPARPMAVAGQLPSAAPPPLDNGSTAGLFNQVQQLQQEVMRLNGVVEQLTHELRQLREQSLERYLDIDRRLAGGSGAGASAASSPRSSMPTASATGASAADSAAGGDASVAEQPGEGEAYRAAYALVRGQEFDAAVNAFDSFLRRFPDGRYAPNAHYWLGELYLVIDPPDPEASRQAFTLLLDQYPRNAKVPDALYKLGRVHFIKGNNDRAREFLRRVMREYPESSAARLAGDFLDQNL